MKPAMVVILPPDVERLSCVSQAGEDSLVATRVAGPRIETLDERVLLGLSRRDRVLRPFTSGSSELLVRLKTYRRRFAPRGVLPHR